MPRKKLPEELRKVPVGLRLTPLLWRERVLAKVGSRPVQQMELFSLNHR